MNASTSPVLATILITTTQHCFPSTSRPSLGPTMRKAPSKVKKSMVHVITMDNRKPDSKTLINNPPRPTEVLSSVTSAPITTIYPHFTRLPVELQVRIWKFALPGPRAIHLRAERGHLAIPCIDYKHGPAYQHVWAYKISVPSILQVCQLSRIIGLGHYVLAFDSNPRPCRIELEKISQSLMPLRRSRRGKNVYARKESVLEGHVLPYNEPALIYVDLERDIFITTHRRMGFRTRIFTHWSEEGEDLSKLSVWPDFFSLSVFRNYVPRETFEKIKTLVLTFSRGPDQLFTGVEAYGMNYHNTSPVLIVKDPFKRRTGKLFKILRLRSLDEINHLLSGRHHSDTIVKGKGAEIEDEDEEGDDDVRRFGKDCGKDYINQFKQYRWGMTSNRPVTRVGRVLGPFSWEVLGRFLEDGCL